jgi:cytochrome c biogenesis protein CcmG, thiol:disulfide interchange protein DsbE
MAADIAPRATRNVPSAHLLSYVPHMKKNKLILAITLLLLGNESTVAATFSNDGKVVSCASITTKAVTTKGTSLDCLDQSSKVKLESITGPVLINVWGSWCAPCRGELPLLKTAYRSGKVKIVGIDVEEPNFAAGQKFAVKAGITWPNLFDGKGLTKSAFGIGVPVTWFLNKAGVVTYRHVGAFTSAAELNSEVSKYLG